MTFPVCAQSFTLSKTPLLQRTIGAAGQDELVSLTTNWRGDIAAIGHATRGDQGGQDISFVSFDAQMNLLTERHIGRKGDDGANQIVTLPDGRYLVVGFSTDPGGRSKIRANYFGKKDGWILVLDERGETEQEILLGTAAEDTFVAAAVSQDGGVWVAGNSGDHAWIVRLSPDLKVMWERRTQYHQLPTRVCAATSTIDGNFFLVGGIEELNRRHLWVSGFSKEGQAMMDKIYPSSQAEYGTGIVATDARTLAIVGTVQDPQDRENGFVSLLEQTGVVRHYQTLGGREYDRINALVKLHNGQLLTAGGSTSFERGSRRISAWLSLMNAKGKPGQNQYYGSKLDDEAVALLEHSDGRLFAVGSTARQVLKMKQGWLFQLAGRSDKTAVLGTLRPSLKPMPMLKDSAHLPRERTFVPFSLENTGAEGQCNLRAVLTTREAALSAWLRLPAGRSILLPPVPAQSRLDWGLPLQFLKNCPAGVYHLQVQFFQGTTSLGESMPVVVVVGENKSPQLTIHVTVPDSGLVEGRENRLLVVVQNTGKQAVEGVTLNSHAPAGLRIPAQITLGDIAPQETVKYWLPVLAEKNTIRAQRLPLSLRVVDGSLLYSATAEALLWVTEPFVKDNPVSGNYTVAVWVYPNPDNFDRKELVWTQEDITVQIKIASSQPIVRQQFCLEINGQPCQTGAKFDEVQIKGDRASKTFSQQIRLQEGENMLRANIQTPQGIVQSEPLKIIYTPAKPNLHIVSIGIPSSDLKYTVKDARDFTQTLASSSNTAFGKIFVDTLLTEERTTKTEIMKALRRLQYRYTDLQILPKDLLVIFVSGHGLGAYDGSFRLAASDYDGPFMQETSLDFEQEIVNYLQTLPCQKLFFVDACHSGTTSGTGLAGIATRKNGLNMLVSCQPNEYSYEDDTWQNGAFTHALVLGFKTFVDHPANLDANTDTRLDTNELFGFIQKEVPTLVEKKRPKTRTSQHPNLFLAESGKAVIVFE